MEITTNVTAYIRIKHCTGGLPYTHSYKFACNTEVVNVSGLGAVMWPRLFKHHTDKLLSSHCSVSHAFWSVRLQYKCRQCERLGSNNTIKFIHSKRKISWRWLIYLQCTFSDFTSDTFFYIPDKVDFSLIGLDDIFLTNVMCAEAVSLEPETQKTGVVCIIDLNEFSLHQHTCLFSPHYSSRTFELVQVSISSLYPAIGYISPSILL